MRTIVARRTSAMLFLIMLTPFSTGSAVMEDTPLFEGEGLGYRVVLEHDAGKIGIDHTIQKLADGLGFIPVAGHDWETRELPAGTFGVDRPPLDVLRPTVIRLPSLHHHENIIPWIENLPLVHHVEPVLRTYGRNADSAALVSGNPIHGYAAAWSFGLNGEGVVLSSADSGIDRGHACFRNLNESATAGAAVGIPGSAHRKMLVHNTSIDEEDGAGDADFGHGTHTAGSLACWAIEEYEAVERGDHNASLPGDATAASHAARLVIQDIVDGDWTPPELDRLLAEGGVNGAIIHSESWGDDTTAYTERAGVLDRWSRENPWSVVLFAPGNTGTTVLEPANARNVISVGASSGSDGVYQQSSKGPAFEGGEGIHVLAPGYSVLSAKADGTSQTVNGEFMSKTGTSMATPMAASTLGLFEQMVRGGWLLGDETAIHPLPIDELRPAWWPPETQSHGTLLMGHGFEPSGPLLRSIAGTATTSIAGATHQSGAVDHPLDEVQGWGRLDMSRLIDWDDIDGLEEDDEETPAPGVWIYDTYRAKRADAPPVSERLAVRLENGVGERPIDRLMTSPLTSSGLTGPFLAEGEGMDWGLIAHAETVQRNGGLSIQLAWADRPLEQGHDDLQVCISVDMDLHTCGNDLAGGLSKTYTTLEEARAVNSPEFSMEGIRLPPSTVLNADSIVLWVFANTVMGGNHPDTLGVDGNRVGFGLTVIGARPNMIGNGTEDGGGIPFAMQTTTPISSGVDPVMLQISRAMGNASIIATEGKNGVDMRVDELFELDRLAQLDIHSLSVHPSHPWDGLEVPSVALHACDGNVPPQCSEGGGRHTEFNSSDLFRFIWDPEFSGTIDVPLSVITLEGGVHSLNLTIFLTKVVDGDLAWFNATGVIRANWFGDLGSNNPTITQSGSTITIQFFEDSHGHLDVIMDNEALWEWEATFTNLEGGWGGGPICVNSSEQAIDRATMAGGAPMMATILDCENRIVEIHTEWKRAEEIESDLLQPWLILGDMASDAPVNLADATWRIPLEAHPWSDHGEWALDSCEILISSDTVGCEMWIPLDAAQSVLLITEWRWGEDVVQDRWTLRGPGLNSSDLVGAWASIAEVNGSFQLLRDSEVTRGWPVLLQYEPLDMISDEAIERTLLVPESWPLHLEDLACKRLRVAIAQRNEVTITWAADPEEKSGTRFQAFEPGGVTDWTEEEGRVNGTSSQGMISIPMTMLGESIKGGCSEVGGDTNANMQRSGEIGSGVPAWIIVGWGAVTAIFVGMILHSRRRQTPEHSDDRINDPFPDDSKESDDEKLTSG